MSYGASYAHEYCTAVQERYEEQLSHVHEYVVSLTGALTASVSSLLSPLSGSYTVDLSSVSSGGLPVCSCGFPRVWGCACTHVLATIHHKEVKVFDLLLVITATGKALIFLWVHWHSDCVGAGTRV